MYDEPIENERLKAEILEEKKQYASLGNKELLLLLQTLNQSEALISRLLILSEVCERYLMNKISKDENV